MAVGESVARMAPALLADAWSYGVYIAHVVDEAQGDSPDHPDDRIIVRGGEHDPGRRVTEDCLQQIHLAWPDPDHWGKA